MKCFQYLLFILIILGIGCKSDKINNSEEVNRIKIIDYLKKHFKVIPQIKLLDSFYTNQSKRIGEESMIDSFISNHLSIAYYKPLNLNFIEYQNGKGYSVNAMNTVDSLGKYCFNIGLIQKINSDTFYLNYINDEACRFTGFDFYTFQIFPNKLPSKFIKIIGNIDEADIKAYNSIDIQNLYLGEEETRKKYGGRAIELFFK